MQLSPEYLRLTNRRDDAEPVTKLLCIIKDSLFVVRQSETHPVISRKTEKNQQSRTAFALIYTTFTHLMGCIYDIYELKTASSSRKFKVQLHTEIEPWISMTDPSPGNHQISYFYVI